MFREKTVQREKQKREEIQGKKGCLELFHEYFQDFDTCSYLADLKRLKKDKKRKI